VKASPASGKAVELAGLMLSAAGLAEGAYGSAFPAEVQALALGDLIQLTLLLGAAKLGLRSAAGHWPCCRLSAAEMADLTGAAGFRTADVASVSIFPGRAGEQEFKQAS